MNLFLNAGTVATTIVSPTTLVHLGLDFVRQEELAQCACTLAVQCVRKDAPNCALGALTLCEKNARAFEEAYQHIVEAAPLTMNSMQPFRRRPLHGTSNESHVCSQDGAAGDEEVSIWRTTKTLTHLSTTFTGPVR